MEVLDWIGADVNDLPRRGVPFRPETIAPLPAPSRGHGYMIFSDIHREPEIDAEFRIDHFKANQGALPPGAEVVPEARLHRDRERRC